MEHAKAAVKRVFGALDARFRAEAHVVTGVPFLDATGGLRAGEVVVLAGESGVGKTSLAISIVRHALRHEAEVLWFALAETVAQTAERLLAAEAAVPLGQLRLGQLQRREMSDLTYAAGTLAQTALHIADAVELTPCALRERARTWREATTGTRALIVVDYLQLVADELDPRATLRVLLAIAKEHGVAVLVVSQRLPDAHARATLESIATAVMDLRSDRGAHELVLAKHRYGPTPQCEALVFDGATFAVPAAAAPSAQLGA